MGTRVPVQHYNLRSANSFIGSSLHDLNTVDTRPGEIEGISDVDRDGVTEDSLDNVDESNSDCMHNSYRNPLPLHGVGVEEDGSSRPPYDILSIDDISPIETARARFLQFIVDHFINEHVIEAADSSEVDYGNQPGQDKLSKRKLKEAQYEGDPRFVLPLMYVANLYETLVNDVNMRLNSLDGIREKTIGVALEAAGGLYRKLAKKFPRKGPYTFKRRELATSLETRTRFPELVIQEEKRVRFVVVNGLVIVEKPNNMTMEDAEWFKRLTGRNEVAVTARDYKFYSPRHKYRRVASHSMPNIPGLPAFSNGDNSSALVNATGFRPVNEPQGQQQPPPKHHLQPISQHPQFHSMHQQHQSMHQSQHPTQFSNTHQCAHSSHMPEIPHVHQSPTMSQHMACLQPLTGGHVGGRLHILPTSPAKYCDECGAPYLRETSKFCSECGVKRLGT
ncbi:PPR containing protein isoform X2 [Tasmannia lanceolata]|uniref:PPR containing protein isoform X2 n=1 Tax=Tasmannia lanceolata TaxID=3420 RepID=UPI004062EDE5